MNEKGAHHRVALPFPSPLGGEGKRKPISALCIFPSEFIRVLSVFHPWLLKRLFNKKPLGNEGFFKGGKIHLLADAIQFSRKGRPASGFFIDIIIQQVSRSVVTFAHLIDDRIAEFHIP